MDTQNETVWSGIFEFSPDRLLDALAQDDLEGAIYRRIKHTGKMGAPNPIAIILPDMATFPVEDLRAMKYRLQESTNTTIYIKANWIAGEGEDAG